MRYEEKFKYAMEELATKKAILKSSGTPPLLKLLKKMGCEVRPPHYSSFVKNALFEGLFFAVSWGLLMAIFLWSPQNYPLIVWLLSSAAAGLMFGLSMAGYYKYSARKHKLSTWDELGEQV